MSSESAKEQADAIDRQHEFGCGCWLVKGQWIRRCAAHRDDGTGNQYIDAALADPTNPIKLPNQCCAHVPGHKCACICAKS